LVDVVLCPIAELTDDGRADLAALSRAVYPPEVSAAGPGRHWEWSAHEAAVLLRAADGELICYAGLVIRSALYDGRPVRVGGIGGVKTHPAARRQGCAARAVGRAVAYFHERGDIEFGLLVCEPHLIGYYGRLGWQEFGGRLLVTQRGVPVEFTLNRVMVCGVQWVGPSAGTIDLAGPPW
jgi:aminoglycoside 2'-N-acetyltransferase I